MKATLKYLANLEWTEKKQHDCKFCHPETLKDVVYEDGTLLAIKNIRNGGQEHWLIMPKANYARHIRDIEALTKADLPLLRAMDDVKKHLLKDHYPDVRPSEVHCGYHRGRRRFIGPIVFPDIVSIHHLHLHVIVRPRTALWLFKYPSWLRLMWISDQKMMEILESRERPRMDGGQ